MLLKPDFSQGVFNGAGQILKQNGLLMTYGVRTKKLQNSKAEFHRTEVQWDTVIDNSTF